LHEWIRIALKSAEVDAARSPGSGTDSITSARYPDPVPVVLKAVSESFADILCAGVTNGQVDYTFTSPPQRYDATFDELTELILKMVYLSDQKTTRTNVTPLTSDDEALINRVRRDILNSGVALEKYGKTVRQICTGKRFGITEHGRMGLFPGSSKAGDEVVLIAGAKVPFVLRRIGKGEKGIIYFKLVGPAFVEGVMYGEGLDRNNDFEVVRIS
jgi:hypothetical protein